MWLAKMIAKVVLSRLPFSYWTFHLLGGFRHGAMHRPAYAIDVVTRHIERLGGKDRLMGATCLELGPGDSLASALIAHAYGASRTILVDSGNYANLDMEVYRSIAAKLRAKGLEPVNLDGIQSARDMLEALNSMYLTTGLSSLKSLESGSVDVIWSQAVLEHVRVAEVKDTFNEFHRVLISDGAMSHRIDFKDHLDGSLNNMRFSSRIWETDFLAKSGFYTNRIRYSQMVDLMENAGFNVDPIKVDRWATPPLPRNAFAVEFRQIPENDLVVKGCDLLATPFVSA